MKYILLALNLCISITLQEAYDNANSYNEYEKYIILNPNEIYTGGIGIYEDKTIWEFCRRSNQCVHGEKNNIN